MQHKNIELFHSEYNDVIRVVEKNDNYSVIVGKFAQSGSDIEFLWDEVFDKLYKNKKHTKILILGFGAGSIMKTIKSIWEKTIVTGIEIDPEMIKIAKKYFPANIKGVGIIIGDAVDYVNKLDDTRIFDLVVVDCYLGGEQPTSISSLPFLLKLKKIATRVIFNQLFIPNNKDELEKIAFIRELDTFFTVHALKLPYNIIIEY